MNRHRRHSLLAAACTLLVLGAVAGCESTATGPVGPPPEPPGEPPPALAYGSLAILAEVEPSAYAAEHLEFGCALDGVSGAPMLANEWVVMERVAVGWHTVHVWYEVQVTVPNSRVRSISCYAPTSKIRVLVTEGQTTSAVFRFECAGIPQ